MADSPLVLIIGSAESGRKDYDPPLANAESAPAAAELLGKALAKAGCRLVVYSSDPRFLEGHVVRGFAAAARKGAAKLVQIRAPAGAGGGVFPEQKTHAGLFDPQPDPNPHWVQSFFRSMADGGGALIIGGGRSALIAGHLALSLHIPLLPVACFGGAARRVWETIQPNDDLPTKEERNLMGRPDWLARPR
jgi:hypothetical protein